MAAHGPLMKVLAICSMRNITNSVVTLVCISGKKKIPPKSTKQNNGS